MMSKHFLRLPALKQRTGYGRSTIYSMMSKGQFPKPYQLGGAAGTAVGWLESDVDAWIDSRVKQSA